MPMQTGHGQGLRHCQDINQFGPSTLNHRMCTEGLEGQNGQCKDIGEGFKEIEVPRLSGAKKGCCTSFLCLYKRLHLNKTHDPSQNVACTHVRSLEWFVDTTIYILHEIWRTCLATLEKYLRKPPNCEIPRGVSCGRPTRSPSQLPL